MAYREIQFNTHTLQTVLYQPLLHREWTFNRTLQIRLNREFNVDGLERESNMQVELRAEIKFIRD